MPAGLLIRRLRPFGLALAIQIAVMVKGGYLPYFYVTAMLPFAALLIGGVADTTWSSIARLRLPRHAPRWVPAVAAVLAVVLLVTPRWATALGQQAKIDGDASSLAATAWILHNVPRQDVVVVDDYMGTDLRLAGMHPLWLWRVDTDPQVTREVLPHGYQSIKVNTPSPPTLPSPPARSQIAIMLPG